MFFIRIKGRKTDAGFLPTPHSLLDFLLILLPPRFSYSNGYQRQYHCTIFSFSFPVNLSGPILKLLMAFWSYFYWKNAIQMTTNLSSDCQFNLQMSCLYLFLLFEVSFSSLNSSALLICVERKMHSAFTYLLGFLFSVFICHACNTTRP